MQYAILTLSFDGPPETNFFLLTMSKCTIKNTFNIFMIRTLASMEKAIAMHSCALFVIHNIVAISTPKMYYGFDQVWFI